MSTIYSLLAAVPQSNDAGWMVDAAAAASRAADVPSLPCRPRIGAVIASVVVTGVIFASVTLGMTSMVKDPELLVAQSHATSRT